MVNREGLSSLYPRPLTKINTRTRSPFNGAFIVLGNVVKKNMEKKVLRYLKNKPKGSANSLEIINNLSLKITYEDFDSIIENLYYRGLLLKPHKQSRSDSDPKYDLIIISDAGKKFIKN
jgi:hypothetical protein